MSSPQRILFIDITACIESIIITHWPQYRLKKYNYIDDMHHTYDTCIRLRGLHDLSAKRAHNYVLNRPISTRSSPLLLKAYPIN